MNFQIYVSGRIQKLFGIKAKEVIHDSKVTLSRNWSEVWRCEHIISDQDNTHLCMFTNAATYYNILIPSAEPHDFGEVLFNFSKIFMLNLKQEGCEMPDSIQFSTKLIKGNSRTLIGVMNQQIYEIDYFLDEGRPDLEDLQRRANTGLCGQPNYVVPEEEFAKYAAQHPPFPKGKKVDGIGPDNVIPFLN